MTCCVFILQLAILYQFVSISPVLQGPILAGTFGTVIKNKELRNLGIKTELVGLSLCIIVGKMLSKVVLHNILLNYRYLVSFLSSPLQRKCSKCLQDRIQMITVRLLQMKVLRYVFCLTFVVTVLYHHTRFKDCCYNFVVCFQVFCLV